SFLEQHRVRNADFADVVQERRLSEALELLVWQPELRADDHGDVSNASRVTCRVGVTGVDRGGESLERGGRPLDDDLCSGFELLVLLADRHRRELKLVHRAM